jgi:hypothetical protein
LKVGDSWEDIETVGVGEFSDAKSLEEKKRAATVVSIRWKLELL